MTIYTVIVSAVCNLGANARADVPTQSVRIKSKRLSQNNPFSKVAENGRTPRYDYYSIYHLIL